MRSVTTPANNPLRDAGPKAFRATLEASALPYGYTLTIWSSGTLLAHVRGGPSVLEIFLFVAGGVGAFIVLSAAARTARGDIASLHPCRGAWLLAGSLAWIGAGGAVGAVALVAEIPSGVAWPLAHSSPPACSWSAPAGNSSWPPGPSSEAAPARQAVLAAAPRATSSADALTSARAPRSLATRDQPIRARR